jgi:hypothetical protein
MGRPVEGAQPPDALDCDRVNHLSIPMSTARSVRSSSQSIRSSAKAEPLFSSDSIGYANYSLLGATSAQLRRWGYHVTSVPSIEHKIDECEALVGGVQFRCWAEADQLLMTKVIPWVPYVFENKVGLVSDRVVCAVPFAAA